jgi:hypothetical protein
MNFNGIKHGINALSKQRNQVKKEEARRREKQRRRNNAIRRVLGRRGKKRPFNPDQEIPPTMKTLLDYVYQQVFALITSAIGPGDMHARHIASFFEYLRAGDVSKLASLIELYSHFDLYYPRWTFFNGRIVIRKPDSDETRLAGSYRRILDTFCKLLAQRLVRNRKTIEEIKKSNVLKFRCTITALVASLVGIIWLFNVLTNPA